MRNQISDSLANSISKPIEVQIIENGDKVDWNIWFLLIAVLSLIAAVLIPFAQKKYEESKSKYGFHLYVKKKIGIVWNLLTYDNLNYKQPTGVVSMNDLDLTFEKLIHQFEDDYHKNRETIHPLFAFGLLFNFQTLLFTVKRIQSSLSSINLNDLDEKTLAFGDKLSKKEHQKLSGVFMLIEHYISITTFHDRFDSIQTIKREFKDNLWVGLSVDKGVLNNQATIMHDLKFLRDNERSIKEILSLNKLLIQELRSYFLLSKVKRKKIRLN